MSAKLGPAKRGRAYVMLCALIYVARNRLSSRVFFSAVECVSQASDLESHLYLCARQVNYSFPSNPHRTIVFQG